MLIPGSGQPHSLYLHIPFCRHRCGYCDFNTYAGQDDLIPAYVEALGREIELLARSAGRPLPVHTVFFGGGTPSLLPASGIERILTALGDHFDLLPGAEVSLEANPGTLSAGYLRDLAALGVNRLSLGMQSARPEELALLERQHDYRDVIQAATWARRAGLDNFNLDLIFGLPEQTLKSWQRSLELALDLRPAHFSLYALTLEHGTPLFHWAARGLLPEPDPDVAADMYDWASERLEAAGYQQYEISNWAAVDSSGELLACRHNLQYWRSLPYLGLGAGAHGFSGQVRTVNVLSPAAYIQRCLSGKSQPYPRTPATISAQEIDHQTEIGETMMMGLRLTSEGVSQAVFEARFGEKLEERFQKEITGLQGAGLLEWYGGENPALRLTKPGRLLGNQVFLQFIDG
jgi:oxygen-independent coproporphyrinogen III oxidase